MAQAKTTSSELTILHPLQKQIRSGQNPRLLWETTLSVEAGLRKNEAHSRAPLLNTLLAVVLRSGARSGSGRLRSDEPVLYAPPATPLFTSTMTSTRRFSARPLADSLGAAGSAMPIAPGATMCRKGTLHFCNRYATTACARSMLNCWFMAAVPDESAKPFTWMM